MTSDHRLASRSPALGRTTPAHRLHTAYEQFLDRPGADVAGVRPVVLDSWRRSRRGGVDPEADRVGPVLSDDELRSLRTEHPLTALVPVVRRLLVVDAEANGWLVALSDERGRMLWVEGDQALRRRAEGMRFVAGADWSEAVAGTNAPGTALTLDRSVQISGAEHYSRMVQPWSCSAAPVHDPRTGALIGVIDVTGGDRVAAPEILTLVRATALAAELELALLARSGHLAPPDLDRLSVLGRDRPRLQTSAGAVELSLRHAEILLLLAEHPEGMRAEELGVELAEYDIDTVTVRAEVSRLRRAVGAGLLDSRPYRLTRPVRSEVAEVRRFLRADDREGALRAYRGPILPSSEAPGVVAVRERLNADVRAALVREPRDTHLLEQWLDTAQGRDDLSLWQSLLRLSPIGSPQHSRACARLDLADPTPPPYVRSGMRFQ